MSGVYGPVDYERLRRSVDSTQLAGVVAQRLDASVSEVRDAVLGLRPARGTPAKRLDGYSLAGGASVDVDESGLDGWSALAVTVRAAYNASATAGVRVLWLYSPDGSNYDSPEDAVSQGNYYDLSFEAGKTRQATILVPLLTPYVRLRIVNLDSAYAATVDVWVTPLR